jgi:ribonuclease HII
MKTDSDSIIIIEDNVDKVEENIFVKNSKKNIETLQKCYSEDNSVYEIGVDEAGRGPLFGRVYTAAVILPKDDSFEHSKMKDSKKFHSKKKIEEVANYIKEYAIAWYVSFEDEIKIDEINILQATQNCMHDSIINVRKQLISKIKKHDNNYKFQLLIDGNYFNPVKIISNNKIEFIPHICIEGGDNKYTSIAAASILAKVSRDNYIDELVKENPELAEKYGIDSNKGYGAKKHIDGIKQHGITKWHRKTFGICKNYV